MLNSIIQTEITLPVFFICTIASLILGTGTAFVSMFKTKHTQSLAITLAVLPAVVQIIIMLVNGSVGAGIAVASVPCREVQRKSVRFSSPWQSGLQPEWAM